jgi:foldase protein PrsA
MRRSPRPYVCFVPALTAAVLLATPALAKEPDVVTVQHVLISFKGRIPGKELTRTKQEAKERAQQVYDKAVAGEDFGKLVEEFTDDKAPGIYKMSNLDVAQPPGGIQRIDMVPKFGDVAFRLEVGEVGLAPYNSMTSPYGWHVIKRLE